MDAVREWALTLCLTLIITGTAYKFLPERSNKNLVRFIVTLICLTAVFRIDLESFDGFELDEIYSSSSGASEADEKIEKYIGESLNQQIGKAALDILKEYDKNGRIDAETENGEIILNVTASLYESEKNSFEKEVRSKLETDIKFVYS